jgi:hypothetical protein
MQDDNLGKTQYPKGQTGICTKISKKKLTNRTQESKRTKIVKKFYKLMEVYGVRVYRWELARDSTTTTISGGVRKFMNEVQS